MLNIKNEKPRCRVGVFSLLTSWTFVIGSSLTASVASADDWSVFTDFESLTYSENYTIYGILDGIDDSEYTAGGEASYTFNEWIVGVEKGAWSFGLFTRYDYLADYTPDAALIAYANEAEIEIPNGNYDIDVRLNHSWNYGARLSYRYSINPNLAFTTRVSGFVATDVIDGELTGNVTFTDTDVSEGELFLDYRFTEDLLFLRDVDPRRGYGASLDAIVDWKVNKDLSVELSAIDVLNRIWWDDLPGTEADATTAISRTAANGVLIVRPTLQGQNIFDAYQQKLRARYKAAARYDVDERWRVSQEIFITGDNILAESGVQYRLISDLDVGASYEWVSGALGANLRWRGLEFGFAADSFEWKEARYAKAYIGIRQKF